MTKDKKTLRRKRSKMTQQLVDEVIDTSETFEVDEPFGMSAFSDDFEASFLTSLLLRSLMMRSLADEDVESSEAFEGFFFSSSGSSSVLGGTMKKEERMTMIQRDERTISAVRQLHLYKKIV